MSFTEIAVAAPFEGKPKINCASALGASPNKPIIFKIPVTGKRPISFSVSNLPKGLTLKDEIIFGKVTKSGNYYIRLIAENELGKYEKILTLEIKENHLLLSPLMGFTSWNAFGYGVSQADMENTAQQIKDRGILEYGYRYINIDSGWQSEYGGKFDAVTANSKFPDMKKMCENLHNKGFLCGIYSSPMLACFGCSINEKPLPPGCTQGEADVMFADTRTGIGVIRKERNNALQWADWGFDYLKYDWKPCDPYNAELMRRELIKLDRDMGFCVTVTARAEYHKYWEKYCNSYRCNPDCFGTFDKIIDIYKSYLEFIPYINKGHYFDLDMLDVGDCGLFEQLPSEGYVYKGFSEDEQLVSYSLRAFFASPIQISSRLDNMGEFEMNMYCNDEIIAINQDLYFDAAKPYSLYTDGERILHIWKRKLENGDEAYGIFNFGKTNENAIIWFDDECRIRDVWSKKDLGKFDCLTLVLPPHTVRIIRASKA